MNTLSRTYFWQALTGGATLLAAALLPSLVQATEQVRAKSPVGLAGEAMGTEFLVQFTVGLVVVLLTVVGLAWLVRRFGRLQSSANGAMRILGGLALSTRERVILVQVGDTQILLGVAPGRVQAVHVLEQALTTPARGTSAAGGFAARLKEAIGLEQTS